MTSLRSDQLPVWALVATVLTAAGIGAATVLMTPVLGIGVLAVVLLIGLTTLTLEHFDYLALLMLAGRAALDLTHTPGASVLRPSVIVTLAFALVACVWLASRMKLGAFRLSVIGKAAIVLAVAATVSVLFSVRPAAAAEGALRFWIIAVMFTTFEHLARVPGQSRRIFGGVIVGAVVPLLVGLIQFAQGSGRLQGTLSHPNTFGFFLTIMFLITLPVALKTRGSWRLPLLGITALMGIELILTYSRSSYLALLVGVVAMTVVAKKYWVLPILAAAVAFSLTLPGVQARIDDLQTERNLSGTAGNSLVWRLDYWQELAELAEDVPGTGIGSGVITEVSVTGTPAHNDLVKAYVETGVLGLIAYLAFVATLVHTTAKLVRRRLEGWGRAITLGAVGAVSAFCTASLGSNIIQQLVSQWYFMGFMALASATLWTARPDQSRPAVTAARPRP